MARYKDKGTPTLYVDGRPQESYRMPDLEDLEGMEVYRGRLEWVDRYGPNDCGVILAWRKADWGEPFNWKRGLAFGGVAAFFLAVVFQPVRSAYFGSAAVGSRGTIRKALP